MSQCEEHSPKGGIRCVMTEGHPPLGAGPDGEPLMHNFGGLGPYTILPECIASSDMESILIQGAERIEGRPVGRELVVDVNAAVVALRCVGRYALVPPRPIEVIAEVNASMAGITGHDQVSRLMEQVDALMPAHVHRDYNVTWHWSTPRGLWSLRADTRDAGYRGWFELIGPTGKWTITDPRVEHIRSVLIVLGAIEGGPLDEG